MILTTPTRGLPFVAVRDVAWHETLFFLFFLTHPSRQGTFTWCRVGVKPASKTMYIAILPNFDDTDTEQNCNNH